MIDALFIKTILCLIAIFGYLYNSNKHLKESYIIWIISNTGWAILSFRGEEYQLGAMFIIYNCFCIYGLYKQFK